MSDAASYRIVEALPALRGDLRLIEGPPENDGSPTWTIHDRLRNRYFQIGREAYEFLRRWHLGDSERIVDAVRDETPFSPTLGQLSTFASFLRANNLVRGDVAGAGFYAYQAEAAKTGWAQWLLHNYLFFRIPLVRPDALLARAWPLVRQVYTRGALLTVVALGLIGAFMVMRQWDEFIATFPRLFSWQGVLWYGLALSILKIGHELGHAFTAHRYGCRVPSMGLAFLVMWPVLYTDTTDAWRLTSRRQRLAIGVAGVTVELAVAAVATVLWALLPDGAARSAAFLVATSSWLLTLTVNLNPCMRFDAYYLLSDALGVQNLQPRAFALAKWRLRELLFGLGARPPEALSPRLRHLVIGYAVATWIYRLVVFTGIAVLVYHYFFKLLGIVLFSVEIAWFIALPVVREIASWWKNRAKLQWNRHSRISAGLLAAAMLLAIVPWRSSTELPALLGAKDSVALYPPVPARIETVLVSRGQAVRQGQQLMTLSAADLDARIATERLEVATSETKLRRAGLTGGKVEDLHVLEQQLAAANQALAGSLDEQKRLTVTAPFDGTVVQWAEALKPGRWVNTALMLGIVQATGTISVTAVGEEGDIRRLRQGAKGRFIPNDIDRPTLKVTLAEIGESNLATLPKPYLASVFGGPVAVQKAGKASYVPEAAVYPLTFDATGAAAPGQVVPGIVVADGESVSIVHSVFRRIAAVFIRESGF